MVQVFARKIEEDDAESSNSEESESERRSAVWDGKAVVDAVENAWGGLMYLTRVCLTLHLGFRQVGGGAGNEKKQVVWFDFLLL